MIAKTSVAENYINDVIDNAVMINLDRIEGNNEISVVKKKPALNAVNVTENDISHQTCISQEENVGNNVDMLPECSKK